MNNKIWLIGSGVMAQDYYKVLKSLNYDVLVVGRSKKSTDEFYKMTGHHAFTGGVNSFLMENPALVESAIVAVSRETLSETTCQLLNFGVKNILVEKPVGLSKREIQNIFDSLNGANVLVGFNRRFYTSVLEAQKIIETDGGVKSFNFEFTEWSHRLHELVKSKGEKVMAKWFLGNSIHVADLAFFLGGFPKVMSTFKSGEEYIEWHPSGAIYAGAGVSKMGAIFSYNANWSSAGRWSIEWLTSNFRIILRPLEELSIQKKGFLAIEKVIIDDQLDKDFKPGLYRQTQYFLNSDFSRFVNIKDYLVQFDDYLKISGYLD